jgi:hypothetical protein
MTDTQRLQEDIDFLIEQEELYEKIKHDSQNQGDYAARAFGVYFRARVRAQHELNELLGSNGNSTIETAD